MLQPAHVGCDPTDLFLLQPEKHALSCQISLTPRFFHRPSRQSDVKSELLVPFDHAFYRYKLRNFQSRMLTRVQGVLATSSLKTILYSLVSTEVLFYQSRVRKSNM